MIVSASYRTDIPAYYGAWFLERLAVGHADVVNPYGGRTYRVPLDRDSVAGFVFWTRNPAPFAAGFDAVARMERPFVVQLTVTGYPRALEPGVTDADAACRAAAGLAARFGGPRIVWRYDPVILTAATPAAWHLDNFRRLADRLTGHVDECVLSFAQIYRKSRRNLDAAGLAWRDPAEPEKRDVVAALAGIARESGVRPTLCAQPALLGDGIEPAQCIDVARLSAVAGRPIASRTKGNRPGCLCAESRDIGRYDACAQGCVYCYANASRAAARRRLAAHDPKSSSL